MEKFFAQLWDFATLAMRTLEHANYKEFLYDWMGGNEQLFIIINRIHGSLYDNIMKHVSWLGDYHRFPLYMILIITWIIMSLLVRKIIGKPCHFYATSWLGVVLVLLVGFLVNVIMIDGLKNYMAYPRPNVALAGTGYLRLLEVVDPAKDFQSFPSGHVAFATLMCVALWPVLSDFFALCGIGFIVLVAWSRVAVGQHFPADAIGAIIITAPTIMILRGIIYNFLHDQFRIKC